MTPLVAVCAVCALCAVWTVALNFSSKRECRRLRREFDRVNDERNIAIDFLHRMAENLENGASKRDVFDVVVRLTATACRATGACVYEVLPNGSLKSAAKEGLFPPLARKIPAPGGERTRAEFLEDAMEDETVERGSGVVGEVAAKNHGILVGSARSDPRIAEQDDPSLKISSLMAVPVAFGNTFYGVLAVVNPVGEKSFSQSDFSLAVSLGEQAGVALHNLDAVSALIAKNTMELDLRLASSVQRYLLPGHLPSSDKLEFAVKYIPQRLIGGDFYDFFKLSNGRFALVVGDVSGKGASAAILMALCQTKLRYIAHTNKSPAQTLKILNSEMVSAMRADMFITMVYAVVDTSESTLTFARAGHELPMVYRSGNHPVVEELRGEGMALGMADSELFDASIRDYTVPFSAGDAFVLYTDGVTETPNADGEEFGCERAAESLSELGGAGAREIADGLVKAVDRFKGNSDAVYPDDLTLLIVKNRNNNT